MPSGLSELVAELCKLPQENGYVEFKENNADPNNIAEYVSALSNTAALEGRMKAYVVWGVRDRDHAVVGTTFRPFQQKVGNEQLENWLARVIEPHLYLRFSEIIYRGQPVVILEIPCASNRPIQFRGEEFIRVGSYRQRLKEHPQLERELWRAFDKTPFEKAIAEERLDGTTVLLLIDYPACMELLKLPLPTDRDAILATLASEEVIVPNDSGSWDITNLGAILFAKEINAFPTLARKAARLIVYAGKGRQKTEREHVGHKGYASGFRGLVQYVNALVPRNEVIKETLRQDLPMYPDEAVRELVANALIHQDFSITGAGPMIEVFGDRIEISNPGVPLMRTDRFLDSPPRSRNERLAGVMRRVGICEERGSGVDRVVYQTEYYQLPAPIFESHEESTRAVLFAHKPMRQMHRDDRVRACYLHACLRYVERTPMTNSSLRDRFGISEGNLSTASRIIRDAVEDGLIKPYDENQGRKYARYLPFWA